MQGDRFNDGKIRMDLVLPNWAMIVKDASAAYDGETLHYELSLMMSDTPQTLSRHTLISIYSVCNALEDLDYSAAGIVHMIAEILEQGEAKYSAFNWAKGMPYMSIMASANRHWFKHYICGEHNDDESGLPHLGHLLVNLFFILHFNGLGRNDLNNLMGAMLEEERLKDDSSTLD